MNERERKELIERFRVYKLERLHKITDIEGDKTSNICPRCQKRGYGFHTGRWKSCRICGFWTFRHKQVKYIQYLIKRGRSDEILDSLLDHASQYVDDLEPIGG